MSDSFLTGAQVRVMTQWKPAQLRARIRAGRFPESVEYDRWRKSEVDAALAGAPKASQDEETWSVDPAAIEMAAARFVRRAAKSAAQRGRQGNVANLIRGPGSPPALRLACNNPTPTR